jgi:hypothetical protein
MRRRIAACVLLLASGCAPQRGPDDAPASAAPTPPRSAGTSADAPESVYVLLQIFVSASGEPTRVDILRDPGNGYGEEAKEYALKTHYQPALDHDGRPIDSSFKTRIRFAP